MIVDDIISLSVALLNITVKLNPNVSFLFQRIHPPEFFRKKYAVDEVHYVSEVSCLSLNIFQRIQNQYVAVILLNFSPLLTYLLKSACTFFFKG